MTVRIETEAGIARVVLDNPGRLNALTATMKDQLTDAFLRFADDDGAYGWSS